MTLSTHNKVVSKVSVKCFGLFGEERNRRDFKGVETRDDNVLENLS